MVLAEDPSENDHAPKVCGTFVENLVDEMTDKEKVGQLFIPWVTTPTNDGPTEKERERIQERGYGAFNFNGGTLHSPKHAAEYVNQLQEWAAETRLGIPVFASMDMEIGAAHRFSDMGPELGKVTPVPYAMGLGATYNTEHAAEAARITGEEARALGFALAISPVADVNTNPKNPVIGVRSFAEDTDLASDMIAAQVPALQDSGVIAMPKHFPGHGDTDVDSHLGLPTVTYDYETLEEVHLTPFKAAIEAGADSIMTAHIVIEAIDPELPATLSHKVLNDLLREEMGFDGLIVTDSMGMAAIRDNWGVGQAAVMALNAGADLIMDSSDEAYDAILHAVQTGEITEARINEAVSRVLTLKCEYGLFDDPFVDLDELEGSVGTKENVDAAMEISRDSITLVKNEGDILPLNPGDSELTILVTGATSGGLANLLPPLAGIVKDNSRANVTDLGWGVGQNPNDQKIEEVVSAAEDADIVIVGAFSASESPHQQTKLIHALVETDTPIVVIALGLPYDIEQFPDVEVYLASYAIDLWGTPSPSSVEAAIEVIFGKNPGGRLPVTIGDLYPYGHGLHYIDPNISAETIMTLVKQFEDEGAFANTQAARSLKLHLTAVSRYEEKELAGKVVKHMKSFKLLLDHQKDHALISEEAYHSLRLDAESLIKKWE